MKTLIIRYCLVLSSLFMVQSSCLADFATPFVDVNHKVGDTSVAHARVVALGHKIESPFLVIVMNDQIQPVVLWAKAKKGVMKESLLGREIRIKAKITKAGTGTTKPELEILQAKPLKIKTEQELGGNG